jgi:hypothetical protein
MPPRLMVRALFSVAMLALLLDLITGLWWVGMVAAVVAWAGFVLFYRIAIRRRAHPPGRE